MYLIRKIYLPICKILLSFFQVVVNLVNQRGREKRVGGELDRVVIRTNLDFVR